MSIFNKLFSSGDKSNSLKEYWTEIKNEEELEKAILTSKDHKIAIFKHSTSCFISKTVLRNFEKEVESLENKSTPLYFIDLLAHRNISNLVAEKLDVRHQSPQLIVIENGKAIANASHQDISYSII